jgi:hypothetical protein
MISSCLLRSNRNSTIGNTARAAAAITAPLRHHSRGLAAVASVTAPAAVRAIRSQPVYTVFGEKAMLNLKVITPTFKMLPVGGMVVDGNKKGRILFEWFPRAETGTCPMSCRLFSRTTSSRADGKIHISFSGFSPDAI